MGRLGFWDCEECDVKLDDSLLTRNRKHYDHDVAVSRDFDPSYVPPYGPPS